MSTPKTKHKKMKLEDLQPKAPELTVPKIEKVTEEFWKPLKDLIQNDMSQVFLRLKESIIFISKVREHIKDPETLNSINMQADRIVKDSEPLMAKWKELSDSITVRTSTSMMPEEALAVSFTFQAEIQQWMDDATVIINNPLDDLLDYCSSKIGTPETQEEEKPND